MSRIKIFTIVVKHLLVGVCLFVFGSCQKQEKLAPSHYLKALNEVQNGLVKTKTIGVFEFTVKYLPLDYLVYNNLKHEEGEITEELICRLRDEFENSFTFLLTVSPAENKDFDVTKVGVTDKEELTEWIMKMSFGLKQQVFLKSKDQRYEPNIAEMEQLFGLQNKRSILFVFDRLNEQKDFEFIYNDTLFNTGVNTFPFRLNDLENFPDLDFLKI